MTIKKAIIVCHDIVAGPPHALRDYLRGEKTEEILFIGHPNMSVAANAIKNSYARIYRQGTESRSFEASTGKLPEVLSYIKDSLLTFVWSLAKIRGKIDLFVGTGNLNAFIGLILKRIGKVDTVIYYVIDFIPKRFRNPLLNKLYHTIEKWCAQYASCTWNYAPAMIRERERMWQRSFPHQMVTPHGIFVRQENFLPRSSVHDCELVYMGFIHKFQGIMLAITAVEALRSEFKNIKLLIIGKGDADEASIREYVRLHELSAHIEFAGFIADTHAMEQIVAHAVLGMALYDPAHPFIGNTDPGKVKTYLGCGVPVIMTDCAPIAQKISAQQAGFIVPFDLDIVVKNIRTYLSQPDRIQLYRTNAFQMARSYDWNHIFTEALSVTMQQEQR
ncbi:MAG: glycosyltransferase [Spirochaetes bacterium]|nr:glycosyltransferase [Spirochaetota bacterium]